MSVQSAGEFRMLLFELNLCLLKRFLILCFYCWSALLHDKSFYEVVLNVLKVDVGVELRLGLQEMVKFVQVVVIL